MEDNRPVPEISVVFFGTSDFAIPALQALSCAANVQVAAVVTQPDRPAGRGKSLRPSPVKQIAETCGMVVLQPENIRKGQVEFLSLLQRLPPIDLGVVAAFGQILPQRVLDFPAQGCINIHASLLPRWRGAAPIQRAILNGDEQTGVCLMRMEAGLDTGPIYSRAEVSIAPNDTAGTLHDRLARLGAELLIRDLNAVSREELRPAQQQHDLAVYADKILDKEAEIDWQQPSTKICRLVRAFSPVPGAFTSWQGRRLKVFQAAAKEPMQGAATEAPGTVLLASTHNLEVQCGGGVFAIQEVQLEGKRRMRTAEFLRGCAVAPGERFV